MSTPRAVDPSWAAGDLLEHARTLAALASVPREDRTDHDVLDGVRALQARIARLDADGLLAKVPVRRRPRLSEAVDRFAGAADDLAAIALLRCTGEPLVTEDAVPDLAALLARVTERHDQVIVLLGRAGIRRTYPTP